MQVVAAFTIENETYAENYLKSLFKNPAYRTMEEVQKRAQRYIVDAETRTYFIERGKSILRSYGFKVD